MARPRKTVPEPDSMVSIYLGADKKYHAYVPVGTLPDGSVDRRHREGPTEAAVLVKVRKLQAEMAAGKVAKAGPVPLFGAYLTDWLAGQDDELRYATKDRSYGWAIKKWLIPHLGHWRMDILAANEKAIDAFLRDIARDPDVADSEGLGSASVHAVYRVLRAALNDAVRTRVIARNPMDFLTRAPKLEEVEISPLFVAEIKAILRVCEGRPNGSRWTIGLPLGLRQGEALGLPWMLPSKSTRDKPIGLDADGGWLVVDKKAERRKWQHGCTDPVECARKHCRTKVCPPRWGHGCGKPPEECTGNRVDRCPRRVERAGCAAHRDVRSCEDLCKPGCTGHASGCKSRKGGGIVFTPAKTEAGRRRISLAKAMRKQARAQRVAQDAQRAEWEAAGGVWEDNNLVWCQGNGKPIDARADWAEWKEILRLAGVRDARVHDGRHAAATMLLLLGVDEQTVMAVMGWADRRMLRRYQHVIDELRVAASERLGDLLDEKPKKKKKGKKKGGKGDGSTVAALPVLEGSATDLATGGPIADVIPIRKSA